MTKVKTDEKGRLILPGGFLERRRFAPDIEFWLNEREGDLILHPRLPNIRKLYIEPTTTCNLHCRTCIRNVWNEPEGLMTKKTFDRLAEGLDELPELTRVVFTGFGEPLAHPGILEMIKTIRERNRLVTLGSNGLLLDEKTAREMINLGVDRLIVSVDGVKPETYASVRGAMLSQVLSNIQTLNRVKSRMNSTIPILGLEFVVLRSNVAEMADLAGLASRLNASRVLVSNVLCYTEETRSEMLYGYEPQSPRGAGAWLVKNDAWLIWGYVELPRMHWGAERRCRFVNDRAVVVARDGGISPCYALSHDYSYYAVDGRKKEVTRYLLGNVNDTPLKEVWMSEDYVQFRSEVRGFHFPSCPDCELREGCDFRGQNEGCWGWNPSCSDCLWAQDIVKCP